MIAVITAAAAQVAGAGAKQDPGMPQFNPEFYPSQIFWLAISFGLLYLILSRVALPRIGEVIEERRDRIQRDLDSAERLKAETEKALADYEKALSDARGNANAMAREMRTKLSAEVDNERGRVDNQIAAKIGEAEKRIAATKEKALVSVNEIATETAGEVVRKLIGEPVGADEVKKALQPAAAE
jgi:F-type H+-transporting ATPase subunit b